MPSSGKDREGTTCGSRFLFDFYFIGWGANTVEGRGLERRFGLFEVNFRNCGVLGSKKGRRYIGSESCWRKGKRKPSGFVGVSFVGY